MRGRADSYSARRCFDRLGSYPIRAAGPNDSESKKKTGRKSIAKLSRKQKLRKHAKAERAETLADRAELKFHRDARKTAFRQKAKSLW